MAPSAEQRKAWNRNHYLKKKKKQQQAVGGDEKKVLWHGRMPETLIARVQRITLEGIATGRYPYKNVTEAMTDFVRRGMGTLKGDPMIDEMLPHLEMAQHLDRIQALRREAQTTLNKARQEISELQTIGASDGALNYFHITMEAAHRMPPTEWRDWLIDELTKSFPDLAKLKPKGIKLTGNGNNGRTAHGKKKVRKDR